MTKRKNSPVSIITICFNDRINLQKTISSIKHLKLFFEVEFIIVDGGSSDGTIDIIDLSEEVVDVFISESDDGIGDAWNKGIELANNEIIGLLNAGDSYTFEFFERSIQKLLEYGDVVTFGNTVRELNGTLVGSSNGSYDVRLFHHGFKFYHPSCLTTMNVYNTVGRFNTAVTIAVDTDWLVRAIVKGVPFHHVCGFVIMDASGVSSINKKEAHWEFLARLEFHGVNKLKIFQSKLRYYCLGFINKMITKVRRCMR
ncbi:glycosyltransferase [Porticoccaceae bacterium]|nr:glycosyltransferase [Porticoccaceae bacterium]